MEGLSKYQQLVQDILLPMEEWQHEPSTTSAEVIFDEKRSRYLLVVVGWFENQNDYSTVVHIDIIDEKIWLYVDKTDQEIYKQLVKGGVSEQDIVKAWLPPSER